MFETDLRLIVDAGVEVMASRFFAVGQQLVEALDSLADTPAEWLISGLEMGSAVVRVHPRNDDEELTCDPLVGMALGQWLGTRVVAQVRRRARWRLATGTESLSWELIDASPLEPERQPSDS